MHAKCNAHILPSNGQQSAQPIHSKELAAAWSLVPYDLLECIFGLNLRLFEKWTFDQILTGLDLELHLLQNTNKVLSLNTDLELARIRCKVITK
jgi:hypothetical protein